MRIPVRHVAGNVVWTVSGAVWAVWRVKGADHVHASRSARMRRLGALEALVKDLHGESMWLSLCPQVDPASIVRRMTDDVDLAVSERYTQVAHRVLDELERLELTGRTNWLAVRLPSASRWQALRSAVDAARAGLAVQWGLMPAAVSAAEEESRVEQAQRVAGQWPAGVEVQAATEAEILWIYGHSARRGVVEPLLPDGAERRVRGRGRGVAALGQAVLVEGGLPREGAAAEESRRPVGGVFRRRWLQVSTEWGESYQAFLPLSEMPEKFVFPGSEYLARLDEFGFAIDWVARLQVTPGAKAEASTRRQARELAGQPEEYAQDAAGVPARVDRAAGAMEEFRDRLTSSAREVEVRASVVLCVWGDSPQQVEARAGEVSTHFGGSEYVFARPLGEMERLFHGMLPGSRMPPVMAQYAQFLLARDFAMAGPFNDCELGDAAGPLYGLQMSGGGVRPVLVDWMRAPEKQASASAAFIGELGSGKSVALKAAVYSVLAAGRKTGRRGSRGRAVMVDRTQQQEWVRFARACPGHTQVITVDAAASVSLDPLRIFTRPGRGRDLREAQRFTESFVGLLLGIRPADELGDVLSEAIERVLAGPDPSMDGLLNELQAQGAEGDGLAETLARKLRSRARKDLTRAVFDRSLPVLDTDADSVVFSVSNLELPKARELQAHHFERLPFEKTFGRAALYLIAVLCRQIAFESLDEFCAVVWDECWWLTSSPEGLELLLELVRDGRKHRAGVLASSHDPDDIGPEDDAAGLVLRGLFPRRYLFRHTDPTLAARGLAFLGLDATDEELLELVTSGLSPLDASQEAQALRAGECLARDLFGRIAGMQVLIPLDAQAAKAIHSDPSRVAA